MAVPTLLALDPASDSGNPGDDITVDTQPAITGIGTPGDTIALFEDGTQLGTAIADGAGNWSIAPASPLSAGVHSLTASDLDEGSGDSAPLLITIAAEPADLALDPASDSGNPGDGITVTGPPTITGVATPGDTVGLFEGATQLGTAIADGAGNWSVAPGIALGIGLHALTAMDLDAGSAPSAPLSLTIAAPPPPPAGLVLDPGSDSGNPGDGITASTQPLITGTASAGDTLVLLDGAAQIGTTVADAGGAWAMIPDAPLDAGTHSLSAIDVDANGDASPNSAALPLTIAAPPATLALDPSGDSGTAGDGITIDPQPAVTGIATPGDTVALFDGATQIGAAAADGGGVWSITPGAPLDPGSHSLTAVDTDAGTDPSAPLLVTIATVPSGLALDPGSDTGFPGDDTTAATQPTITGLATAGETIALFDGATQVGSGVADGAGAWSIAPDAPLGLGVHSLTATDLTAASAASAPLSVTIADPPLVLSVAAASPAADIGAGQVVTLTTVLNEAVTVTGTPALTLNDGEAAEYAGGSGTDTLTFRYTVLPGDNTPLLAIIGSDLAGGSILDGLGNAADLSGAVGTPTGAPRIDTAAPTVNSVASSSAAADLGAGQLVTLTAIFGEPVTVSGGTPTLTLNGGGTAVYLVGSGTGTLSFGYTVANGDNTPLLAVTGSDLGGATIMDAAGNSADLSGLIVTPAGAPAIDTTDPTVSSVTASSAAAVPGAGDVVTLTAAFNEPVTVVGGTPMLVLNDGETAAYAGGSGSDTLSFRYTVLPGDHTPLLAVTGSNLAGATIVDAAGNAADLSGLVGTPAGAPQIDASGSATGDVHMMTFDGLRYDFQAVGDFTLVRSTAADAPLAVQIRTSAYPLHDLTSVTTEVAAKVGADQVRFDLGGSVTVDGSAATHTQSLDGGMLVMLSPHAYELDWANGESLLVTDQGLYFDLDMRLGPHDAPGSVQGLMGNHTGDATALQMPDGVVLKVPLSDSDILGRYADAWRVSPSTSMLSAPERMAFVNAAPSSAADAPVAGGWVTALPMVATTEALSVYPVVARADSAGLSIHGGSDPNLHVGSVLPDGMPVTADEHGQPMMLFHG